MKKDDDKEGMAPVDASKIKGENLEVTGGKCWKNIWMVWLEITGEPFIPCPFRVILITGKAKEPVNKS